ncbi:MAG: CotH kinase family protein [Bacteroidales bacterium]|nr:CotH kinase family protein [Bacteroidales bacterium]
MKRHPGYRLLLLMGILLLAVSCREDRIVPETKPTTPPSFLEMVHAYRDGKTYVETRTLTTFSKVFFQDGTSVVVPTAEWVIEDGTDTLSYVPKTVVRQGTNWFIDGEDTGIGRTNGPLEESIPLYAYRDLKYLRIWASNGETMEFDNGWEPEKPEEPVDPPKPPYIDPLHDKAIPSNFQIPTVHITTEGGKAIDSKDHYVNATFRFEDPSRFYTDEESLELTGRIKGRGNTTWGMPKKPYRIKLDEKAHVFSRWGNKDWILLANYSDKTLLRNIMAMEISRICGMSWTPMMLSVEVYVNGQYQGVYAFSDHKEIAGHRVNIEVATETDLEGGYYLELEEAMDEPVCFKTVWDTPVMFHEPEYPTEAQQKYVREWFNGFEHALERVQGEHDDAYRSYIDVPSFINYYIIQEITKNPDGNVRKSTYLTKEKGKPLEMYHVWDFDITLGNCDYTNFEKPEGWQMRYVKWYNQMFFDPAFKKAVVDRWNELYPTLLTRVPAFLDRQHALMAGAESRNFDRWQILGVKVWPNYYYYPTYEQEYAFLKEFYEARLAWLNDRINAADY